jgi:hypothetical protein
MYTSDAGISYLPATESIAVANEIVKRLGRLNEDVTATMVFAEYDSIQRERAEIERAQRREDPRELAAARSRSRRAQYIINNIKEDSFTTITLSRQRKPAYWLHRDKYETGRVIVQDRKGVLAQVSVDAATDVGKNGRDYVSGLLSNKLAEGARVDQGVRF